MTEDSINASTAPSDVEVEGVRSETVSEPVKAEDPNAFINRVKSEKDRAEERARKAEEKAAFWQQNASISMSEEARRLALAEEKARTEAEARAEAEQRLMQKEAQAAIEKLVSDKYPHLKGEDLLQNVSGSPEEIELQLKQVDEFVRRTQSRLAKEESAKKTAQGVSPAAAPASAADLTVEEYRQMDPNTKQKIMFEKQREWLKSLRENM